MIASVVFMCVCVSYFLYVGIGSKIAPIFYNTMEDSGVQWYIMPALVAGVVLYFLHTI